jgi:hypothetical protein
VRSSNVSFLFPFISHVHVWFEEGVTISNPNDPSIMSRTRSATLPTSIIEFRSDLTSMNVIRRFFPATTVTGPLSSPNVCLVYRRTSERRSVVLPTPGGPAMATMMGGGRSSGVRETSGTCSRFWECGGLVCRRGFRIWGRMPG